MRSAPPHTGSPGPFGPGTPEESEKSPERAPRGRAPKVPKECAPESRKSPQRVRKSDFRLFSDSFETPGRTLWALLGRCAGYSFRTLFGLFLGPRNPRTTPTKSTSAKLGVVRILPFSLVPTIRTPPCQKCYLMRKVFCGDGAWLAVSYLLGVRAQRARETLCGAGPIANFHRIIPGLSRDSPGIL